MLSCSPFEPGPRPSNSSEESVLMWPSRRSAEKERRAASGELGEFEQPKSRTRLAAVPKKPSLILGKHMAASASTVIHNLILNSSASLMVSRDGLASKPSQVAILLSRDHNLIGERSWQLISQANRFA